MADELIREQADRALSGLELDIATYHPVVWGMSWEDKTTEKIEKLMAYYEELKRDCVKKLPGTNEIGRKIFQEFIRLADQEIKSAEAILFTIKEGK